VEGLGGCHVVYFSQPQRRADMAGVELGGDPDPINRLPFLTPRLW